MGSVGIIDPSGEYVYLPPSELATGRGNLRSSSVPAEQYFSELGNARGSVELVGGNVVSYARLYAEQPWIGASVRRLISSCVRVPLKAYRRTGEASRERLRVEHGDRPHPVARAIIDPWEGAGQPELVQSLLGPLLVHGNGLISVDEGASGAIRFDDLDWRTVVPIKSSTRRIAGWTIREDSEHREVGADRVVHVKWWSPLGPLGVSPLRQLGTTVRVEDAAQRYQRAMLLNGARPPSAITASEAFLGLDPAERSELMTNLRGDVTALYAGPENSGRPALLPPGLDWKPVGHTAVEAELIDQRKIAREEIAAVYLLPPPMIGILDKATYSNIGVQREMFYTESLGPPLVLIEQALNAQLIRQLIREDDVFVEFDFAGVLRGDRLKEIQALREAIGSALMVPNEGRAVLNLPRSDAPGMDEFYLPQNNLRPVGERQTEPGEEIPLP